MLNYSHVYQRHLSIDTLDQYNTLDRKLVDPRLQMPLVLMIQIVELLHISHVLHCIIW